MHVLGTPPAFILSQDQTLRLKCDPKVAMLFRSEILVFYVSRRFPFKWGRTRKTRLHLASFFIRSIRFSRFSAARRGRSPACCPASAQGSTLLLLLAAVKNFFQKFLISFKTPLATTASCSGLNDLCKCSPHVRLSYNTINQKFANTLFSESSNLQNSTSHMV